MFTKDAPSFAGARHRIDAALNFPRPLRPGGPPLLIGGSGERRTIPMVARYADACNFFGDAERVRHKLAVLHEHCEAVGRDPGSIQVTHLGAAPDASAEEHVGRLRELAEAGVRTAIVSFRDAESIAEFGQVIEAFR